MWRVRDESRRLSRQRLDNSLFPQLPRRCLGNSPAQANHGVRNTPRRSPQASLRAEANARDLDRFRPPLRQSRLERGTQTKKNCRNPTPWILRAGAAGQEKVRSGGFPNLSEDELIAGLRSLATHRSCTRNTLRAICRSLKRTPRASQTPATYFISPCRNFSGRES